MDPQDPYYWITDPDPALFSVAFKMPTNYKFLLITFCRYIYIIIQRYKLLRSHKVTKLEIKAFIIFVCDERFCIHPDYGSRSGTL
jgi:hypothetical protein